MKPTAFIICILFALPTIILGCKGITGPQGPVGPSGTSAYSIFIGGDNQAVNLSYTPQVIRQINMTVHGSGIIVFQASGYFFDSTNQAHTTSYIARVSWSSNDSTMDRSYLCVAEGDSSIIFNPYVVSRSLKVDSAGTYNIFLLGDLTQGGGIQTIRNSVIATFTPN